MTGTEGLRGTILLIEDDPGDVIIAQRAFEDVAPGIVLHRAENGADALDRISGSGIHSGTGGLRPDLILLDLNMPGIDGREFLQRLREIPAYAIIPVVVLTTSQAPADIVNSYNDGCNSYITKSVDYSEFCKIVAVLTEYWFGCVQFPEATFPD